LGRARAEGTHDSALERASLEAAAEARDFVLEARPEGVVVRASAVFSRGPRPNAARLGHLLDLTRAHPRGPTAIILSGEGALARRQLAAIRHRLGADAPGDLRFEIAEPSVASPAGTVELLFFAFAR
jgi:hypothetical protein